MVSVEKHMTDEELMKAIKPLLHKDEWKFFIELLRRWQGSQIKRALSVVEPHTIYRSQGQAAAYDAILSQTRDIKKM